MRRAVLVTGVAWALACLLLGSCTSPQASTGSADHGLGRVDVDTPALRQAKATAGVAACRRGSGTNRLPAVTLACLGGGPDVDLTRLRGPLVINLFASWCGPCRGELPYYQDLHEKAKGRLTVLGVDYEDPDPGAALDLAERTGVTYPLLADPGRQLRPGLRIAALPGVVLVDAEGRVDVEFRVVRSYAELRALVEKRLDVRLPA